MRAQFEKKKNKNKNPTRIGEGTRTTGSRECVHSGWRIILLDESDREKVEKQSTTGWNVSVDSARSATRDRRSERADVFPLEFFKTSTEPRSFGQAPPSNYRGSIFEENQKIRHGRKIGPAAAERANNESCYRYYQIDQLLK